MSRDHSQNHYGPNASFDGYDSDLASAGILIESLRQQLAAALAACKLKDAAIKDLLEFATYSTCGKAHAVEAAKEALTIQPDDQLAAAYEAGKREASEDIEQAALEKWLYDKCPSGDVESVQRQWLESYEYAELAGKMEQAALNERDAIKREWDKAYEIAMLTKQQLAEAQQTIERQAAQIEMMRDFIETAPVSTGVCCCGESMEGHSSPMSCGHTPVDLWDHSVISVLSATPDQALEQFAAKVREQCAKVCESEYPYTVFHTDQRAAINCAAAIRNIKELPK